MAGRRRGPDLDPEESALWQRVTETVRPLRKAAPPRPTLVVPDSKAPAPRPPRGRVPPPRVVAPAPPPVQKPVANNLDASWDRRIERGGAQPDRTIDLHGHTLAAAHRAFDLGLAQAVADGVRVLLLVTGRPPRESGERGDGRSRRGAIRAEIEGWIASSPHADRIAAVRGAHPRHGGLGAMYLILRRSRP